MSQNHPGGNKAIFPRTAESKNKGERDGATNILTEREGGENHAGCIGVVWCLALSDHSEIKWNTTVLLGHQQTTILANDAG